MHQSSCPRNTLPWDKPDERAFFHLECRSGAGFFRPAFVRLRPSWRHCLWLLKASATDWKHIFLCFGAMRMECLWKLEDMDMQVCPCLAKFGQVLCQKRACAALRRACRWISSFSQLRLRLSCLEYTWLPASSWPAALKKLYDESCRLGVYDPDRAEFNQAILRRVNAAANVACLTGSAAT